MTASLKLKILLMQTIKSRLLKTMALLPIAAGILSCAPSSQDEHSEQTDTKTQGTDYFGSNTSASAFTQTPTNVTRLLTFTYESGRSLGYQEMARSLFRSNTNAWNVIHAASAETDSGVLADSDYQAIESLLRNFKHFTPDGTGTLVRYAGFAIAVIGGRSGDLYWNAYLLRAPRTGWTFLEFREVPLPRH